MEKVLLTEANVIELINKCLAKNEDYPGFDSTVPIGKFVAQQVQD